MLSRLYRLTLSLLVLGCVINTPVQALSSDRDQPMHIEADHADINDQTGVHVYTGNVVVTQGSMRLTADHLTLQIEAGEIVEGVALGEPATYKQRPDNKDEDVYAESLRMEYYAGNERIILIDEAEVTQAGDIFRSERIVYDVARDVVNAGEGEGDRVRITIQPRNSQE
ncbi:lipopolysaccharide transport periplasmic protein LptA [Thiohalobacter thiocyanaticus]|nr:lipopolysaccharide transport periplasmic protein LptA [Thiohalobacter thiocyanaticus]